MVHTFMHQTRTTIFGSKTQCTSRAQLNMLLGDVLSDAEDPIFPHSQKHLNWGKSSNLEVRLKAMT